MKTLRIAALGALMGIAACNGVLGSDDDNFSFQSVRINYTEGMEDSAEAVGIIRTIQVDGVFILPHPCHELRANFNRVAANIEIVVVATPTNTTCPAAIQAMQYKVDAFGMSRGVHRVTVYHQFQGQQRRLINQTDVAVG